MLGSLPLVAACGSGGGGLFESLPANEAAQLDDATWPMSGRNHAATRFSPIPANGLTERWRVRLAGGVLGASAVRDGMVYAASFGGEVVAVELETGREIWRRQFPLAQYGDAITQVGSRGQAFYAGPATDGSRLWVASDRVWCLDRATGETVWESEPLRSEDSDDYFWGAPVLAGGLILAGTGSGSELPRARGAVSAYDRDSGALVWSTRTVPSGGNGGGVIVPVTVDLVTGRAFAVTGAPYAAVEGDNPGTTSLVELDLASGQILWLDQAFLGDTEQRDFNSSPMLVGDHVFATNKDGVWAWDRRQRIRLWQTGLTPSSPLPGVLPSGPTDGPEGGPLAWSGSHVLACSNDAARASFVAAALTPASGEVVWQTRLPGLVFAAPAVAGAQMLVSTATGQLYALNAQTGAVEGVALLGEPSSGAVTVAAGRVLVGTGAAPYLPGDSLICLG